DLQARRVGDKALEIGSVCRTGRNLDDVGTAVTRRQLHDAQAVALGIEPHSLGVDRNRATVAAEVGQIATMQSDGHGVPDKGFKANSARWRGGGSRAAYQPIARVLCLGDRVPRVGDARRHYALSWCPGEDSNLHGY